MPEHHLPIRLILTSLLVLVGACSDSESPAAPPTVASILITPQLATLTSEGATQQFLAQPLDQDGGSVVGVTVKWSSSNSSVVEIDETIGLATAVAEGNVTVTAESGTAYGQASVSVDIPECTAPVTVTLLPGQTLVTDPPASATCALRLPSGNAGDRYRVAIVRLSAAQDSAVVTASLTLTPKGGVVTSAARLHASASAPPPLLNLQQMALLESSARVAEATSRAHERLRTSEEDMLRRLGPPATPQFPIARAYAQMRAAELVLHEAIRLYEQGENPGEEANMAKMLAADASWAAAEACVQTHGGFGFAEEYDIERKFRESRLYQVAPISTEHVLGMPRSY